MTNKEFTYKLEPIYDLIELIQVKNYNKEWMIEKRIPNFLLLNRITYEHTSIDIVARVLLLLELAEYITKENKLPLDGLADELMALSRLVLIEKAKEYSNEGSRFSNFYTAAKYMPNDECNQLDACISISAKHFAWIEDAAFGRITVTEKGIKDHFVDAINYTFIYYFMLTEEFEAC